MTQDTLERTEQARGEAQAALDARKSAGQRNRLGQFATPPRLALQMAALAREHLATSRSIRVMKAGYRMSGLAGLYCYFLILAHRWLSRNGVGVWIVPAEFLDVN